MSACGGGTIGFMWVLGDQYNQIVGYKIDDFTGNLTQTVGSPYPSGGSNPISIALRTGGTYAYVVNKGTGHGDGNIAAFAVGDDGILTFLQTYTSSGNTPVWAAADGTGSFLYVLDSQSPTYGTVVNGVTDLNGDITVFAIDPNTGRLQLVPNQSIKNAAGTQLTYYEVGPSPTMVRYTGSCLYTLDSGNQTIFPYGIGGSGQLTYEVNALIPTNTVNMTSINSSGSNFYVTDAGSPLSAGGSIIPYTTGSGCSLSVQADGPVANLPLTSNPVYSIVDSKNKYLYVLNHSTTNTNTATTNSSISAFTIDPSTGRLQALSDIANPYAVGNGPVCMVEDPSNQYVYTSNNLDGTVTGKVINQNTGQLSALARGSTFPATGLATCLVVSGNVD
jgi:6-phosphogluconolactonase (cycloisomerase 2 family)